MSQPKKQAGGSRKSKTWKLRNWTNRCWESEKLIMGKGMLCFFLNSLEKAASTKSRMWTKCFHFTHIIYLFHSLFVTTGAEKHQHGKRVCVCVRTCLMTSCKKGEENGRKRSTGINYFWYFKLIWGFPLQNDYFPWLLNLLSRMTRPLILAWASNTALSEGDYSSPDNQLREGWIF